MKKQMLVYALSALCLMYACQTKTKNSQTNTPIAVSMEEDVVNQDGAPCDTISTSKEAQMAMLIQRVDSIFHGREKKYEAYVKEEWDSILLCTDTIVNDFRIHFHTIPNNHLYPTYEHGDTVSFIRGKDLFVRVQYEDIVKELWVYKQDLYLYLPLDYIVNAPFKGAQVWEVTNDSCHIIFDYVIPDTDLDASFRLSFSKDGHNILQLYDAWTEEDDILTEE